MSQITTLFYLLLLFLLREISHLSFFVLLTLTFIFLSVSLHPTLHATSLTSSLVFFLYLIIGCYIRTYSLLVFFIMYELSLFPVCLLIILFGYQPEKIKSMFYLLLYTVVCSAPFFYTIVLLYCRVRSGFSSLSAYTRILVCLSFMVKSPMYTLHSWLPKAHVEASLIGSMLLAGVILKLGRYGLLLLAPHLASQSSLFIYLTLTGGIVCSAICCRNWDMKSLVAYSSVVHIGVVTLGALRGLELGFWVAGGILVGHSLLSPLIFSLAYELYLSRGRRNFVYGHTSSVTISLLFAVRLCSGLNFGLPPFLNFWVEVSLFSLQGWLWSFSLLPLILTAFLSFLYSIFFYVLACGGTPSFTIQLNNTFFIHAPAIILSLLITFRSSILLF